MPQAVDWAYAAGLLDGEGCIFIGRSCHTNRQHPYYNLRVAVCMTDAVALRWLRRHFGGTWTVKPTQRTKRREYVWELATSAVAPFLLGVLPFLKVKAVQARWALRFRTTVGPRGTHRRSVRTIRRQQRLYEKLRALKLRSVS